MHIYIYIYIYIHIYTLNHWIVPHKPLLFSKPSQLHYTFPGSVAGPVMVFEVELQVETRMFLAVVVRSLTHF